MTEGMKEVAVGILERDGKYRVDPPEAEAFIYYENGEVRARDAIVFRAVNVGVLVVLPGEAVGRDEEIVSLEIGRERSKSVSAGKPGVYSYVVACRDGQGVQSAVANSDPTLIIGRRG